MKVNCILYLSFLYCFFQVSQLRFLRPLQQNLPGKLGQQSTICWNSLGLSRDYGLNYIFFGNKTVLFFKIESWNFQHLFEKRFRETSQNFNSFSSFRHFLFSFFLLCIKFGSNETPYISRSLMQRPGIAVHRMSVLDLGSSMTKKFVHL